MNKFTVLWIVSLICATNVHAQNKSVIDSLLQVVASGISDKKKVDAYVEITDEYSSSDSANTALYADRAVQLAEQINYPEGKLDAQCALANFMSDAGNYTDAEAIFNQIIKESAEIGYLKGKSDAYAGLGTLNRFQSNFKDALEYHSKALKIKEKIGDKLGLATVQYEIAIIFRNQGDYAKAQNYFFQSLKIREELADKLGLSKSYNGIAIVHTIQGNYVQALDYHFKSLEIKKELGFKKGIASSYNNIGIIHSKQGNYKQALDYQFKALEIRVELGNKRSIAYAYHNIAKNYSALGKYESALDYYFQSLEIRKKLNDKKEIAASYNNIGNIYQYQDNYQKALDYYFKSLEIKNQIGTKGLKIGTITAIGEVYRKLNKLNLAKRHHLKALGIAKNVENMEYIAITARRLAVVENDLGNYQAAYEYRILYNQMQDKLHNKELTQKLTRLEMNYEFQQEKDSIQFANSNERQLLEKSIENKEIIQIATFIVLSLVVVLLLVSFFFLRSKIRANKQLSIKNHEIQEQSEMILILNKMLEQNLDDATKDLLIKNEKLSEYAHYNSHETRAPIARLLGLIQLITTEEVGPETAFLLEKIKECSIDLDEITRKMNRVLEEAEFFEEQV